MRQKWLFILIVLGSTTAFAFDYPYTMRSPRALMMGDAFTAVNDDGYTLFYNPASLARHKNDFTFYPLNGHISGTNVLNDLNKFKDPPQEPIGMSDLIMDYPIHLGAGVAPGFKLFNIGVTMIASDNYDLLLRNKAFPMLDLDIRNDRGVAFGIGVPLGSSRINRKHKTGQQTSLGLGAKYIERTGVKDTLALTGPTVLDSITKENISGIVEGLGRVRGVGWGFDAGVEHIMRSGSMQLALGLAALDITGTEFKVAKNPDNLKVSNNRDQINLGVAGGQDFKFFHYVMSADVRAFNEEMDFGKRLRFGAQVGTPLLTLMAGLNSGYYSYGLELNLIFMKLSGGFYDIELGSKYQQIKSKRFVIFLSLFDFSFDA